MNSFFNVNRGNLTHAISLCYVMLGVGCEKLPDHARLLRTLRRGFITCNLQLQCCFSGIQKSTAQRSLGGCSMFHCVPGRQGDVLLVLMLFCKPMFHSSFSRIEN